MSPDVAAVALLSGGLDSCVAVAIAVQAYGRRTAILHAGYGQRTAQREQQAAQAIAAHYELDTFRTIDLGWLRDIGGSSLTDASQPVPAADDPAAVPTTYVPFRNAILLAAAVAWAEVLGAGEIYCGAHAADSAYPDTQPAFFTAFDEVVRQGTPQTTQIIVRTPLLDLDKEAIVRRGDELQVPLHLTWSCYQRQDQPCDRCHSCHLRARGFAAAGVPDPLASY
jgi:7-cyano-7-deazaguanine synthase